MKKVKDSNKEYHAHKSISASGLKTIFLQSVYHHLNKKFKYSPAMNFGSAVHEVLLEDNTDNIVTLPELNLRTKAGREERDLIVEKNKNKIVITQNENENIRTILYNYRKHNLALKLLGELNEKEVSYYGKIDSIPVRIRPDGIKLSDYIIDIKTCQDASPKGFRSAIYRYAYHLQAVFYSEGLGYDPKKFRFIAIENQYPFNIAIYSMSEDMIERGKEAWRLAFSKWQDYINKNIISSYNWDDINNDGSLIL
jgi:hypothetical protein